MFDKRVLVLVVLVLMGCEKDCENDFMTSYNNLQNSYELLFNNPNSSNADQLKNNINSFLSSFDGVKCKSGSTTLEPTSEVKGILAEMNSYNANAIKAGTNVTAKLVYGDDDRVDLEESSNSSYRTWGRSTMAQIAKSKISANGNLIAQTLKERYTLCDGEQFSEQLTAARCSGFLVAPDILITAGHCMEDINDCDENVWALDYVKGKDSLNGSQIFECAEIIDQALDYTTDLDYAVVRLNRPVTDRKYFRWRSNAQTLQAGQSLVVIGHPSGLPTKVADGASVKDNSKENYFSANLDTFGGNSGSAVINSLTGVVEGILVRGETDYTVITGNDGKRCMVVNQCSDTNGCDGDFEEVTRMSSVSGIPHGYSEESIVTGIVERNTDQLSNLYGIKLYGREIAEYSIAGRSFLGKCGIGMTSDDSSESERVVISCGNTNALLNQVATYLNNFYY